MVHQNQQNIPLMRFSMSKAASQAAHRIGEKGTSIHVVLPVKFQAKLDFTGIAPTRNQCTESAVSREGKWFTRCRREAHRVRLRLNIRGTSKSGRAKSCSIQTLFSGLRLFELALFDVRVGFAPEPARSGVYPRWKFDSIKEQ